MLYGFGITKNCNSEFTKTTEQLITLHDAINNLNHSNRKTKITLFLLTPTISSPRKSFCDFVDIYQQEYFHVDFL